MHYLDELQL